MTALQIHPSINFERVLVTYVAHLRSRMDGSNLPYPGFCVCCGWEATHGVDEDDCGFICELCDEPAVYGAVELLLVTRWVHDGQELVQTVAEPSDAALPGVIRRVVPR